MGSQSKFLNTTLCFNSLTQCAMKGYTVPVYSVFFQCRLKIGDGPLTVR